VGAIDRRMLIAIAILALLALSVGLALTNGSGGRSHPPLVGFNDNAVTYGVASPEQTASLLAGVGARIDRVQFGWRRAEPQPGVWKLAQYDAIYRLDLKRHVQPLYDFGFAPQWAADPSCNAELSLCPPATSHLADAARAAAMLARRYPKLAGIEIWNEPNLPLFWTPRADVAAYTRLLIAAYRAIKQVAPSMPVIAGSISDSPVFDTRFAALPDFLRGIYRNGGGPYMDAISLHPYPEPGDTTGASAVAAVRQALAVLHTVGDHLRPVWVTETGISTTGRGAVTEAEQAAALIHLYDSLRAIPAVRVVIFHTLLPQPAAANDPETGFAILHRDMRPTPAFCALSSLLRGSSRC
jgi:hypothetical protein